MNKTPKCPKCGSTNMFEDDTIIACKSCHYNNIDVVTLAPIIEKPQTGPKVLNDFSGLPPNIAKFLGDVQKNGGTVYGVDETNHHKSFDPFSGEWFDSKDKDD